MNSKYSTEGVTWSGYSVAYFSTTTILAGRTIVATQYYDSNAITSEGYNILTEFVPTSSCVVTTTPTLPPSPSGSICSPHGDHCKSPKITKPPFLPPR